MRSEAHDESTSLNREGAGGARMPLRIVVIDDSLLIRYRVKHVLAKECGLAVVGEAENGLDGVRLVRELRPDMVVMDIKMPLMDGVEATLLIKAEFPDTVVVGLSSLKEREILEQFMSAGAAELVDKSRGWSALVAAIRRCIKPHAASAR